MPRITHVKKAQPRYATVPVLNEDGTPKRTPVMRRRTDPVTGEVTEVQKVTKKGRPVFMAVTAQDKSTPKPMPVCDDPKCKQAAAGGSRTIQVGQPYKHITPKSGPYGGRTRSRHEDCANWQVWEYSSSLSARCAQISHDAWENFPESAEDAADFEGWAQEVADAITELAEEKQESADNIEDGFGHSTSASEELADQASELESWASDVTGISFEGPEPEPCPECDGTGEITPTKADGEEDPDAEPEECTECGGTGETALDEDALENWRDQCREAASVIDESPF